MTWQNHRLAKLRVIGLPRHFATSLRYFHEPRRAWQPWWGWLAAVVVGLLLAVGSPRLLVGVAGAVGLTAVFLLILRHPLVGLGLALLAGPWAALENVALGPLLLGGGLLNSGQLLLLLTLAAWLGRGLLRRQIRLPHTFLNLPLALYIYLLLLTLLTSYDLFTGVKEVAKWLQMGLIVWLVVDIVEAEKRPFFTTCWLLIALLLSGLSQALVGIWQFGLSGTGPEHFMILGRFYRAYGTFGQPNPFGGFMNIIGLLAWGLLLGLMTQGGLYWWQQRQVKTAKQERIPSHLLRPTVYYYIWLGFAAVCAGALTLALIFSWSRGAWLGFAAGGAVLLLAWPRRLGHGMALLALAAGLLWGAIQVNLPGTAVFNERVTSFTQDLTLADVRGANIHDANYAVLERLAHWQAGLDMARDYPWLGVGIGNYEPAYADYALLNWPYALGHAHNYYINLLAETGIVGLVGYILFWSIIVIYTIHIGRRLDWPWRGVALGLLATWVGLAVHHLVDKLYVNNLYIHLGTMWALLHLIGKFQTRNI